MQEEVSFQLEQMIEALASKSSVTVEDAYSIYALAAALEYPPMADTDASFGMLLRHCRRLRAQLASEQQSEMQAAYLDMLQVIAGAYFGQDGPMRALYREHGVHV